MKQWSKAAEIIDMDALISSILSTFPATNLLARRELKYYQ